MKDKFIITIDGPAGAGKTTIAKMLADSINFNYVDTGAMYRAITLKVLRKEIPFTDVPEIEKIAEGSDISMEFTNMGMDIYLDGENVSEDIRSDKVTNNTSIIAAIPGVRYKLAGIQREAAEKFKNVVFEGRDMGTMVFPQADLKVYLDAGIQERASRRWKELGDKGIEVDIEELKEKIKKRDILDESRGLAPLRIPEDAHIIDSTKMDIEEVVGKIIDLLDR
ncbi:(d)CMP kinase [Elusimicrobiota bacterium]